MTVRLASVLADILPWARATFPQATPYSIAEHLRREATELARTPTSAREIADVAILLYELADAVGVDVPVAMADKHAENLRRDWGIADADGVVEHVRSRPDWNTYWFEMARLVATRATCPRASIGAVLVRHKRIIATGYNGAPEGEPHCLERDTTLDEHMGLTHCPWARHAEINALRNAFSNPYGATLYVVGPREVCINCTAKLRDAGVTDICWRRS